MAIRSLPGCWAMSAWRTHPTPSCITVAMNAIQWPAMVVTLAAAWCVGSRSTTRRRVGFWLFLLSNLLWIIWGVGARADALIVLQCGLALMNIRGQKRNSA